MILFIDIFGPCYLFNHSKSILLSLAKSQSHSLHNTAERQARKHQFSSRKSLTFYEYVSYWLYYYIYQAIFLPSYHLTIYLINHLTIYIRSKTNVHQSLVVPLKDQSLANLHFNCGQKKKVHVLCSETFYYRAI